jgi:hypothetical protein
MGFSGSDDVELQLREEPVIVVDEGQVHCDALLHRGLGEALSHPVAVGLVGELLANLREVVLAMGVLNMSE